MDNVKAWLEKAKKELKVDDLSEKSFEYQGFTYQSFAHKYEVDESIPARTKDNNDWKIGLKLYEPTENVVPSLFDGAEHLAIALAAQYDPAQLKQVLNGVEFDHLTADIFLEDDIELELSSHANLNIFSKESQHIYLNKDQSSLYACFSDKAHEIHQLLGNIAEHIDQNSALQTIVLDIKLGKHILFNIAHLRALRILAQNLITALDKSEIQIEIAVSPNGNVLEDDNFEQNLIILSSIGLSAVAGGCDKVFLTPKSSGKKSQQELNRLAFNIQHILKHESRMDEVIDPTKGSFFIEDITKQMVTHNWSEFTAVIS